MSDLDAFKHDTFSEKAAKYNCDVEFADDYTLQIDCDNKAAEITFVEQLCLLMELELINPKRFLVKRTNPRTGADLSYYDYYERRTSRSGNTHFIVRLENRLDVKTRLFYQALLGSDLKREALSYKRVELGNPQPILLFVPKKDAITPNLVEGDIEI